MKKNKISKNWLIKQKKDPFFKQSKIQGFRSRSAFKLIEMDKKFKILKKNLSLLDLGSCPGGWSQVARKKIINGKILAVDIKPMEKIYNVDFIKGDFSEASTCKKIIFYFNTIILFLTFYFNFFIHKIFVIAFLLYLMLLQYF